MKAFFAFVSSFALAAPAMAGGYTSSITDTVRLDVQGAGVQSMRTGNSYAVSGSNVKFDAPAGGGNASMGGLGALTSGASAISNGSGTSIVTPGSAFSFSQSSYQGDTINAAATSFSGTGTITPAVYGNSTISTGGVAGNLAGSLSAGTANAGVGSVTAGGAGTSATLQRSIDLSVFQ